MRRSFVNIEVIILNELKAIIIPTEVKDTINEDSSLKDKKEQGNIGLTIPQILNFDVIPANDNGIEVLASRWTSGNRQKNGEEGILIKNGKIIIKEKRKSKLITNNKLIIKLIVPKIVNIKEKKDVLIL